ncbi:YbaB/EbfC family nucleoid-associated protein [Leptospira sp. GIMC2001]|uniref:YbaB/EbfC family nucleoid-associated protein n=1 Tax=Leptospira sp. GIMC2001 TaxID=1513297 RepID=UPI00234BDFA7|nr:YbaB/EbfC family nucleoid-associated protein [Leptospira sp. GIMC2001]WCL48135.1 YbaB/EbfC family nucleoid-associated protein [Leptospira sp. GIMC2001]
MFANAKDKFEHLKKLKRMRSQVKNLEKELLLVDFEGESKGGQVVCIMDGKFNIKKLDIKEELLEKKDKKSIEKAVIEAVTKALSASQKGSAEKIQEMGGLPGLGM